MANGVEQQIGIGNAQVLPTGPSHLSIVPILNRQKQYLDETERYNQQVKKQEEKDLYAIVGDALNLRDFNPVIHDNVRKAKTELAKQLMTNKPSLAEAHLAAQNYAQELGLVSDQFNQADKLIALSKEELKGDKRMNLGAIEGLARKELLEQYKTTGKIDLSENPFDKARAKYPEFALTDNSDYGVVDFKNARMQPLEGSFTKTNTRGGSEKYGYKTQFYPDLYDFKDNGEGKEPTLSTRSEDTGMTEKGMDKMLTEEAYGFYNLIPSNRHALDRRIRKKYGDVDLQGQEAEQLRRIEAYNDVEAKKPKLNETIIEKADPQRSHSFYFGSGFGQQGSDSDVNKLYERVSNRVDREMAKGFDATRYNSLANDEQEVVKKAVENAGYDIEEGGKNVFLYKDDAGVLKVYRVKDDGTLVIKPEYEIATLSYAGTNLPKQVDVKGKRKVVANSNQQQQGSHPLPKGKPRTVKQNGVTYTWNEQSGQYQ